MVEKACYRSRCEEPRRDIRGSAGMFCSDECLQKHKRGIDPAEELRGLASDIATGDSDV